MLLQWPPILSGVRSDHEAPSVVAMCFAHFVHEPPCTTCAARNCRAILTLTPLPPLPRILCHWGSHAAILQQTPRGAELVFLEADRASVAPGAVAAPYLLAIHRRAKVGLLLPPVQAHQNHPYPHVGSGVDPRGTGLPETG
jgi:hypothetical protein